MISSPADDNYWGAEISDLALEGNKTNQSSGYGIEMTGLNGLTLKNLFINNTKSDSIHGVGTTYTINSLYAENVMSYNSGGYGIYLLSCNFFTLNSCFIEVPNKSGIYAESSYGEITSCRSSQSATQRGMEFVTCTKIVITGCSQIAGNYFEGILFTSCLNSVINGNIIYDNNQKQLSAPSTYYPGIQISGTSSGVIITNNRCFDDQSPKSQRYGLTLGASTVTNCTIGNNDFKDSLTSSVSNDGGAGNIFYNNKGYIAPGEIRTYSGTITAGGAGTITSLDNPFGQVVRVLNLDIKVTTGDADAPNIDADLNAANNSVAGLSLFDNLTGETAGYYLSTIATPGTQTVPQTWGSGSGNRYLNIAISDNDGTQLVATYTVTVMGN